MIGARIGPWQSSLRLRSSHSPSHPTTSRKQVKFRSLLLRLRHHPHSSSAKSKYQVATGPLLVLNSPAHPSESTTPMAESTHSSSVDPRTTEIIVVRHGETEWNADGRIQGHLDVELNEVGREQASLVADRISKEFNVSAVYSSDLKRALVTAETIADRCGGLEVIKDKDLRERHLGDLQGHRLREASEVSPQAYRAFMSGKSDQDLPGGGESLDRLFDRCTSSMERIGEKHRGEQVVVVTHGGVIRQLHSRANPIRALKGKVLNTSLNIFCLSDEDKWTLKTWGDISHLNQTGLFLKNGFGGDATSG